MSEKRTRQIPVVFHQPDLDRLEAFRALQPIKPSMASTIRGLVRLGLETVTAEGKRMAAKAAKDKAA